MISSRNSVEQKTDCVSDRLGAVHDASSDLSLNQNPSENSKTSQHQEGVLSKSSGN